jgi:hypothetical protein
MAGCLGLEPSNASGEALSYSRQAWREPQLTAKQLGQNWALATSIGLH